MYSARITRNNPTAFIFLIDRSGSMEERINFGSRPTTKAEVVAMVTNMMIRELINRCRREDGIMDYFDIAAIGYSANKAEMLLGSDSSFAKPSRLAMTDSRKRVISRERILPDGKTLITNDELKYWIEPRSEGNTPMKAALEKALSLTGKWCRKTTSMDSYPPTVFNITDGEATDGDYDSLVSTASQIKQLQTLDGNVILININISSSAHDRHIIFPGSKDELPLCRYAEMLYDMSSEMPAQYNESIHALKPVDCSPPFRGMSFNTSVADLIAMLNIGSRSINKML